MNELYVEAGVLHERHLTGVARLVVRLIEALAGEVPLRLTTTPLRPGHGRDIPLTRRDLPPGGDVRRWVDRVLRLPRLAHDASRSAEGVMLYTLLRPPARHFRRELSMLYDFTPILTPQYHTEWTRGTFGRMFAQGLPLCDGAIAISESTRSDTNWLSGIDPANVIVRPPGPSQCVHEHAFAQPLIRRDDLILVVATMEPRKNARFVLDWFLTSRVIPKSMRLCWVGPPGWMAALGNRPRSERILFPGMVSDSQLCRLYREATFTIYPSLYEGFGFPVLDSLWHDCPVACAYNSSLGEFADIPGVYPFDACDADTLDEACGELLASRDEIRIDRTELARRYSWEEMARAVVGLAFGNGLKSARTEHAASAKPQAASFRAG